MEQRAAGNFKESRASLDGAVELALAGGDLDLADTALLTLAGAAAMAGDVVEAENLTRALADRRDDVIGDQARAQLGAIYNFSGRYDEGSDVLAGLSTRLEESGAVDWAARVACNRGWCLIQTGEPVAAIASLRRGRELWLQLNAPDLAADAASHLAVAHGLLGDIGAALSALDQARRDRPPNTDDLLDAARLYEQSGLVDDAMSRAAQAISAATDPRQRGLSSFALARLHLSTGRFSQSIVAASDAVAQFATAKMHDLGFAASVVEVAARAEAGIAVPADLARLVSSDEAGGSESSLLAAITRGRLLVESGELDAAADVLADLRDSDAVMGATMTLRAKDLEARIAAARGRPDQAVRIVESALDQLANDAADLGATDLAVAHKSLGAGLAELGIDISLRTGDVAAAIAIDDRRRYLDASPRGTRGRAVEQLLIQYRLSQRSSDTDPAAVSRAEQQLVHAIRTASSEPREAAQPVRLLDLCGAVGSGTLITFLEAGGELHRIAITETGVDELGILAAADVETAVAKVRLRFGAALADADPQRRMPALKLQLARLDRLLFSDVEPTDSVVLIPPPGAYGVPWRLMPTLRGRRLVINSNASAWYWAARRPRTDGPVAIIVGPGLRHAAAELAAVESYTKASTTLSGARATVAAALDGVRGASLAHIAAHGVARTDNPLFSSLELADGPMTIYEMQAADPPENLVVSACAVGRPRTYRGGLAVGLPAVALAAGTRTVVASEVDVPDSPTRIAMSQTYEHLAAGADLADALRLATDELLDSDLAGGLAAAAFSAYGAG